MAIVNNNNQLINVQALKQGRTKEQCAIIDYFTANGGCMGPKPMSDEQFMKILKDKIVSLGIDNKSLNKLGIDIDEVQEIQPVTFAGYDFANQKSLAKRCNDGKWRCSGYQITKIYFSDKQIYFYQYSFDLTNDSVFEFTDEYFYKDVTNFSSGLETVEKAVFNSAGGCMGAGIAQKFEQVQYSSFRLVVPGDIKKCSMNTSDEIETAIRGMKSKLREKKGE